MYIATCKKVAGEWYLDLFHDVIIKLHEKRHLLNKAIDENRVESLVLSCIYTTFIDAGRKRKVQIEYVENYDRIRTGIILKSAAESSKQAVGELYRKMNSMNEDESKAAKTLWSVCNSNLNRVVKESGKTRFKLKKEIEPIIKDIKRKINE